MKEHLESNPIESLVDTEDPQFGADFLGKIERFVKRDGSGYMEVDRDLRLSCPKLQEMYNKQGNNFAFYCNDASLFNDQKIFYHRLISTVGRNFGKTFGPSR